MPNQNEITFRSDFDVTLVEVAGSDELICKAARVSTMAASSLETKESAGLINALMREKHGSPFEHSFIATRISGPIFMWREFMRHRIGVSYNEQSGRYMELAPVFYMPPKNRMLVQTGKAINYSFEEGSEYQRSVIQQEMAYSYRVAWESYQKMLTNGIAKEVARMVLPLSIYSTAYVTMNPRSLMSFLSLRTKNDDAMFKSNPQWEINQVANQLEKIFAAKFPLTYKAYGDNGRVAP